MKQLIKFVSMLVIGALAVLPALASLPCAFGATADCAPGCPMAMNSMGPDCPMSMQMSAADCPQNCCSQTISQAMAAPAAPEKLRFASPVPSTVLQIGAFEPRLGLAAQTPISPPIASPPRYILIHVFRV